MRKASEIFYEKCPIISNEAIKVRAKLLRGISFGIEHYPSKVSPYRLLLVVKNKPNTILTISQSIYELINHSIFAFDLLNVWAGVPRISKKRINEYEAVIIHNTASYTRPELEIINELILKKFEGIKVLMKQDENYRTNEIVEFVKKSKIDLVLTIWNAEIAKKIYSSGTGNNVEVMQYLTGYVPDSYKNLGYTLLNRKIDIGYRGSVQSLIFGRLCYEKWKIGEDFMPYAVSRGLSVDISSRKEDRFVGQSWLDFLGNCKSVLGVESGSYVSDFDGKVRREYEKYIAETPNASDEEVLAFLEPYEHGIPYTAISPRHFEAAACKTLQVMYEGKFQGIFEANKHYLPLKRDYSNVEEIIDSILDDRKRKEIVECAFEEIVMNDEYSFGVFVDKFDKKILGLIDRR